MSGPGKSSNYYRRECSTKPPTISDMIQSRRAAGMPYVPGELREGLVQREMARHNFTEAQALAGILAFCRKAGAHT